MKEFCKECHNILYPKEDKEEKQLFMACRTCEHFEEAKSNTTYYVNYENKRIPSSILPSDIVNDHTLPRVCVKCPECKNLEAICYYGDDVDEEVAFLVYYVCSKCCNIWIAND